MKKIATTIIFIVCAMTVIAEEKLPFEIQRIVDAKHRKIDEIEKQYQVALRKQKDTYIRRKDVESAKLIDSMLLAMVDTEKEKEAAARMAEVEHDYDQIYFRKGVPPVNNKSGQFVTVPPKFKGWKLTKIESVIEIAGGTDAKKPLKFTVVEAGNVLIVSQYDFKKDNWKVVDEFEWQNDVKPKAYVYMKHLDAGEYELPNPAWMGTHLLWK